MRVIRAGQIGRRFYPPRSVLFGSLCRWVFAVIFSVFGQSEIFSQQQSAQSSSQNQAVTLSPEQQAALDRLLVGWESRNAKVTTWSCTFYKWEYNAWSPADASGERLAFF